MIDNESLQNLEKLHQLKTDGVITEEDFEAAKQRLLLGNKPRSAGTGSFIQASGPVMLPDESDHFGWITMPLKRFADFTGRSSRKEFWMFQLVYVALLLTCVAISIVSGSGAVAFFVLGVLGLIVPQVAVHVRRFHDQDRSGWFALMAFIPYLGPFIIFGFMLVEGTRGENQFGPDPLAH